MAEHGAGAALVVLHLVHVRRRLDRDAAGVEGDPLADQGDAGAAVPPLQPHQARLVGGAGADGQQAAHAAGAQLLGAQHRDVEAAAPRRARARAPPSRSGWPRWPASWRDRGRRPRRPPPPRRRAGPPRKAASSPAGGTTANRSTRPAFSASRLEAVEAVAGERQGAQDAAGGRQAGGLGMGRQGHGQPAAPPSLRASSAAAEEPAGELGGGEVLAARRGRGGRPPGPRGPASVCAHWSSLPFQPGRAGQALTARAAPLLHAVHRGGFLPRNNPPTSRSASGLLCRDDMNRCEFPMSSLLNSSFDSVRSYQDGHGRLAGEAKECLPGGCAPASRCSHGPLRQPYGIRNRSFSS